MKTTDPAKNPSPFPLRREDKPVSVAIISSEIWFPQYASHSMAEALGALRSLAKAANLKAIKRMEKKS